MSKIRISAVSYTNSKPFVYGLEHSEILNEIELSLDNPSDCAQKLIDNQVDIGLIPVAALPSIKDYEIVSDYCIGADGAVNSVFIFSTKPIDQIQTLKLDSQSRTSNALARILLKEFWKVEIEFTIDTADAYVEIGDRTFGKIKSAQYVYDLAEEWKNFTGLPFTFAVWASNKKIDQVFLTSFNKALKMGLDNRDKVIAQLPPDSDINLHDYLLNKIDYNFDENKRKALQLFLTYLRDLI
ncbi:MAG: menaquinone biosynthesis protein [Sphingobacteriaceae bacterium]|nr:menaquinone biosynthesis protein [Sphingobacteriaceae bacterium]